jgi:PAP2 superfamily protein
MKPALVLLLLLSQFINAQSENNLKSKNDTLITNNEIMQTLHDIDHEKSEIKSLTVPAILIGYGFVSLVDEGLQNVDISLKHEIREDNARFHTNVDDYLQYAPAFAVYGLNAIGIKGKNNFRDRTMIYLTANAIMGITVQTIKAITKVPRPDGFGINAFPSGHTATAFLGAEFLHQEYSDKSQLYGAAGYLTATATGILRMYNNRHWMRDVIAGAGYGMISAKLAYITYPYIKRKIFRSENTTTTFY